MVFWSCWLFTVKKPRQASIVPFSISSAKSSVAPIRSYIIYHSTRQRLGTFVRWGRPVNRFGIRILNCDEPRRLSPVSDGRAQKCQFSFYLGTKTRATIRVYHLQAPFISALRYFATQKSPECLSCFFYISCCKRMQYGLIIGMRFMFPWSSFSCGEYEAPTQ